LTHIEHKEIVLNPHWVSLHHVGGFHQASLGKIGEMLSRMGALVYLSSGPAHACSFSRLGGEPTVALTPIAFRMGVTYLRGSPP